MKKALLLLFVTCFFSVAFGTSYYSDSNNSNPNDLNNWWTNTDNSGSNPTSFTGDDVFIIQSGHNYTTESDWMLNELEVVGTLNIGAHTVDVAENVAGVGDIAFTAAGTLKIGKSFSNTGTFTPSTSTVEYYGSVTDINAKACDYYNVTINKATDKEVDLDDGTMNIDGELKILSGTLDIRSEDGTGVGVTAVNVTGKTTISGGELIFFIEINATTPTITMNEVELSGGGRLGGTKEGIATCTSLTVTGNNPDTRISTVHLTVSGTTIITGDLNISSEWGTKTFAGDVIVNGTWTNTSNANVIFESNLTVNGTFNTSGADYTFTGTSKSIGGTAASITMDNATIMGSYISN